MIVLAMEENRWDRRRLRSLLKKALPGAELHVFDDVKKALRFAETHPLAAAFIDMGNSIHIPGYFLAQKILAIQRTNIIFTNHEWTHAQEAMDLRVSGYMRKPLQYEDIVKELQNLRYSLAEAGEPIRPPPEQDEEPQESATQEGEFKIRGRSL